jgi:hypothetical protein
MTVTSNVQDLIGVYHLVRKRNGLQVYLNFIASLQKTTRQSGWRLVLIFKGFNEGDPELQGYEAALAGIPYESLFVSDEGFDITAYFKAAAQSKYQQLIFFNSFSEILSPDWLDYYRAAFCDSKVGLIAATGTFESNFHNFALRMAIAHSFKSRVVNALKYALKAPLMSWGFPAFPNPHLRSNAFMIRRDDLLALRRTVRTKLQALRFESGRNSLSRYFLQRQQKILMIDRTGKTWEPEQWKQARVFRQSIQEDLLVSDNQTRAYDKASPTQKAHQAFLAWGNQESFGP